jgi:hypothetical protein
MKKPICPTFPIELECYSFKIQKNLKLIQELNLKVTSGIGSEF